MPLDLFFRLLAIELALSCLSGLLLIRPMKAWPAARWLDHPAEPLRWLFRFGLFVSCVLLPTSFVWIIWTVILGLWGDVIGPNQAALPFQLSIALLPLPFAFLLYRLLANHVRTKTVA
jgi:hypothetical protein